MAILQPLSPEKAVFAGIAVLLTVCLFSFDLIRISP